MMAPKHKPDDGGNGAVEWVGWSGMGWVHVSLIRESSFISERDIFGVVSDSICHQTKRHRRWLDFGHARIDYFWALGS